MSMPPPRTATQAKATTPKSAVRSAGAAGTGVACPAGKAGSGGHVAASAVLVAAPGRSSCATVGLGRGSGACRGAAPLRPGSAAALPVGGGGVGEETPALPEWM